MVVTTTRRINYGSSTAKYFALIRSPLRGKVRQVIYVLNKVNVQVLGSHLNSIISGQSLQIQLAVCREECTKATSSAIFTSKDHKQLHAARTRYLSNVKIDAKRARQASAKNQTVLPANYCAGRQTIGRYV